MRLAGIGAAAVMSGWLLLCLEQDPPKEFAGGLSRALSAVELQVTVLAVSVIAVTLSVASLFGVFGIDRYPSLWVAAILPLAVVGYVVAHFLRSSQTFGRGVLVVGVAALLTLTVRASLTASFENKDTPVDMLVYTQTSPDVPKIMDRIEALARASGLGYNLPIVVDSAASFTWPWAWYLRDYNDVSYPSFPVDYELPSNAVLLMNTASVPEIETGGYSSLPYKHRWWFCESYRDVDGNCLVSGSMNFKDMTEIVTDPARLKSLFSFFLQRREANSANIGSQDGVAFFPLELSAFDVPTPPREPARLADGRIVIGTGSGLGSSRPGEFQQPGDLFVDPAGNLWIADGLNNRIQKFDANGNFLEQIARPRSQPDGLREPWSLAVDADGFVYVADTWNHRILKFSPQLTLVDSWGGPRGNNAPGPLEFYGPRDIAIAPDGTLWVTDTGNNRLLRFSKDGEVLDTGGATAGAGLVYAEPVGLTFDAAGGLLVADAWSGNLLRFGADLTPRAPVSVGWTSRDNVDKPYVTVLADGRILLPLPETGELVLFDASGQRLAAWQPFPDSKPVGVVALPDGGFAFSDIRRHEVQIVPASQIAVLFR